MKQTKCPTCGQKIRADHVKRARVAKMRRAGKKWIEIGKALGVSTQAAWALGKRAESKVNGG